MAYGGGRFAAARTPSMSFPTSDMPMKLNRLGGKYPRAIIELFSLVACPESAFSADQACVQVAVLRNLRGDGRCRAYLDQLDWSSTAAIHTAPNAYPLERNL